MNNLEIFEAYSEAFEEAYETGEWSRVGSYFHEDAVYEIVADAPLGVRFTGREAILEGFARALDEFDYRFDTRSPVITEPSTASGDTVRNGFVITYAREGLPDVVMPGSETATFRDGRIIRLENQFSAETAGMVFHWMGRYLSRLPRPPSQQSRSDEGPLVLLEESRAEAYWLPAESEGYATILVSAASSPCNAFSMGTHVLPEGGALPERCFARGDFVLVVEEGKATIVLDGKEETLTGGDTVAVARQTPHRVFNAGVSELRLLWFCIPGGYEELLRRTGRRKTGDRRPDDHGAVAGDSLRDYYLGPEAIGSLVPGKGESLVVREAERTSFWQSMPARGYADMIVSPHNYSSNAFSIGAQTLLPGASIPSHAHSRNEELLFVTDGRGAAITEKGSLPIRRGNALFAGRYARHGFQADPDSSLTVVWIFSPPELETVLSAMGRLRSPGEAAPAPFPPPGNITEILANGGFAPM